MDDGRISNARPTPVVIYENVYITLFCKVLKLDGSSNF